MNKLLNYFAYTEEISNPAGNTNVEDKPANSGMSCAQMKNEGVQPRLLRECHGNDSWSTERELL